MQVELSNEELRKLSTELARVTSTPLIHVRSMYGSGLDAKPQRLPILENLCMRGNGESLKFFAQSGDKNFNVGLCYTVPYSGVQGNTVIPASKFAKLVAAGKSTDKVTVEVKDTLFENAAYMKESDFTVSVEASPLKAILTAKPWWDYPNGSLFDRVLREGFEGNPNITEWEKPSNRMSLTGKELKSILKSMKFAMSGENERVSLRGICFDFASNRYSACAMAATDGSRVVVKFFGPSMPSLEGEVEIDPENYIVPVEAIELLYRLLGNSNSSVVLQFSNKVAEFTLSGGVRIVTQLVDGRFPDYFMVLPDKALRPERFICDREELIAMVKAVMPFTNKKYKGVQLLLGEKELVILARNPEGDKVSSTVSEKHIHSRPAGGFCMGFNGDYLLEMLDAITTEQVELSSNSSESICLITPQDEDSWHYMLAPMRL